LAIKAEVLIMIAFLYFHTLYIVFSICLIKKILKYGERDQPQE